MAKLVGPLFSSEARGRMGGVVYGTWRGKSVAKAFKSPCQPHSALQLKSRALLSILSRAWGALDVTDRATWTAYAVAHTLPDWTGQAKRLTGANWYVALSSILSNHNAPIVDTAPVVIAPDAPEAFAAATGIGQSILSWTAGGPTTTIVEIRANGPHTAGRLGTLIGARFVTNVTGELGTITVASLIVGTYTFFVRRVSLDDGQTSPWLSATAVITAV